MSICIVQAGILDTVQDLGRTGYGGWGINTGGVMDRFAAQAANVLAGNAVRTGVIEMHFPAARILFERNALISITGADFKPYINEVPVGTWRPLLVRKGSVLSFRGRGRGNRCYISVHGGLVVAPWLGSVSTNLKTGTGGPAGQALQKGDRIQQGQGPYTFLEAQGGDALALPWSVPWEGVYDASDSVFFTAGREWPWLSEASQQTFVTARWRIDSRSDRMGYYLNGTLLSFRERRELLSSGVSFGTVQALPGGGMVVLMADHQTTGGYPRVAHVVSAHLPRLAQLGAHEEFRFRMVTLGEAEKMVLSLQSIMDRIARSCADKLQTYGEAYRS